MAKSQKYLRIPPRQQWENNNGYCGEVALTSAGLMYGQYVSQFDAHRLATNNQLDELNFDSSATAAKAMHLNHDLWSSDSHQSVNDFLVWVKQSILAGTPVMIGIYMNLSIFGELEDNGQNDYDHIVPVVGIESNHDLSDQGYYDDDYLIFSDNALSPQPGQTRTTSSATSLASSH